jgi:glutamine transport system substrate-binding protein
LQRSARWLVILLAAVMWVTGCGSRVLVQAGTDAQYPPFEEKGASGELTGFDIDLMKAIAEEAGFEVQIKHTGWDPMFQGIEKGKMDAAISAITITEERKKKYDFSDPYFEAKQLILVPAGSAVKSLQDLKGKRIGVQAATTGEQVVQKAFGKGYKDLKKYKDVPQAIKDLQSGLLDAVVADNGLILFYLKELGEERFKTVEDPSFPVERYGIMVKKGNRELLDKINAGLKKIKEDGIYDQIFLEYFASIETSEPPK